MTESGPDKPGPDGSHPRQQLPFGPRRLRRLAEAKDRDERDAAVSGLRSAAAGGADDQPFPPAAVPTSGPAPIEGAHPAAPERPEPSRDAGSFQGSEGGPGAGNKAQRGTSGAPDDTSGSSSLPAVGEPAPLAGHAPDWHDQRGITPELPPATSAGERYDLAAEAAGTADGGGDSATEFSDLFAEHFRSVWGEVARGGPSRQQPPHEGSLQDTRRWHGDGAEIGGSPPIEPFSGNMAARTGDHGVDGHSEGKFAQDIRAGGDGGGAAPTQQPGPAAAQPAQPKDATLRGRPGGHRGHGQMSRREPSHTARTSDSAAETREVVGEAAERRAQPSNGQDDARPDLFRDALGHNLGSVDEWPDPEAPADPTPRKLPMTSTDHPGGSDSPSRNAQPSWPAEPAQHVTDSRGGSASDSPRRSFERPFLAQHEPGGPPSSPQSELENPSPAQHSEGEGRAAHSNRPGWSGEHGAAEQATNERETKSHFERNTQGRPTTPRMPSITDDFEFAVAPQQTGPQDVTQSIAEQTGALTRIYQEQPGANQQTPQAAGNDGSSSAGAATLPHRHSAAGADTFADRSSGLNFDQELDPSAGRPQQASSAGSNALWADEASIPPIPQAFTHAAEAHQDAASKPPSPLAGLAQQQPQPADRVAAGDPPSVPQAARMSQTSASPQQVHTPHAESEASSQASSTPWAAGIGQPPATAPTASTVAGVPAGDVGPGSAATAPKDGPEEWGNPVFTTVPAQPDPAVPSSRPAIDLSGLDVEGDEYEARIGDDITTGQMVVRFGALAVAITALGLVFGSLLYSFVQPSEPAATPQAPTTPSPEPVAPLEAPETVAVTVQDGDEQVAVALWSVAAADAEETSKAGSAAGLVLPTALLLDTPGAQGPAVLSSLTSDIGKAVRNTIDLRVDHTLTIDAAKFIEAADLGDPIRVDLPSQVELGDVTLAAGADTALNGGEALSVLQWAGDHPEEGAPVAQEIWAQFFTKLADTPEQSDEEVVRERVTELLTEEELPAGSLSAVTGLVAAMGDGSFTTEALPVTSLVDADGDPRFVVDYAALGEKIPNGLKDAVMPLEDVISVAVRNGAGTPGLSVATRGRIVGLDGIRVVETGNAERFGMEASAILLRESAPNLREAGRAIADALGLPEESMSVSDETSDLDIVVVVGLDVADIAGR